MRTTIVLCSVLLVALALGGCLEPKSHTALERDADASTPGGPWDVCEDAQAAGRSADVCTFEGGCAREEPIDHWSAAYCLHASDVLLRYEFDFSLDLASHGACPDGPVIAPAADGCIAVQNCEMVHTFCVPDALLPPRIGSPPVVLESEADCEVLLADEAAAPGGACSGDRICRLDIPGESIGTLDPTLVWCHAERLRYAVPFGIAF